MSYDPDGRINKVESGELSNWPLPTTAPSAWTGFTVLQVTDTTYDNVGRKVKEQLSAINVTYMVTQFTYDVLGRLHCTAERMNPAKFTSLPGACALGTEGTGSGDFGPDRITSNVYDAAGQLTQLQKAVGTSDEQVYARYTYTLNGKQQTVEDANGNLSKLQYDGFDRLYRLYFPSKTSGAGVASTTDYEQYGYDNNGNRTSLRRRDTSVIGYQYDALNRMSFKDIPGGTSDDVYFTYDLRGLQTSAMFGLASGAGASTTGVTTAYDGVGRALSTTNNSDGFSRKLSYLYDADGNRLKVTHPDNLAFTYGYDGLDRAQYICESTAVPPSRARPPPARPLQLRTTIRVGVRH